LGGSTAYAGLEESGGGRYAMLPERFPPVACYTPSEHL
jgi:hypothetical protein